MPGSRRRDPRLEQFWRDAVAAWQESGKSVRAFCAGRRLSEQSFYAWRRTLRERDGQQRVAPPLPRLVPLRVVPEAVPQAVLEVVLPAGLVVRVPAGAEAVAVAHLVAALRAATC
jgi:transposase-like protein